MKYQELKQQLGRKYGDPEIEKLLKRCGITQVLSLGKDETDVRVDAANGITLIFSDEAFFHQSSSLAIGAGDLIYTGFILILQHPELVVFDGALPNGLSVAETKESIRNRFGVPTTSNENFRWDEFKLDEHILLAVYSRDHSSLARIGLRIPSASDA